MVSKEPVTERHRSDREVQLERLESLKQRIESLDRLLTVTGALLEEPGIEICSACGEVALAGRPGETKIVVHCAKSVP